AHGKSTADGCPGLRVGTIPASRAEPRPLAAGPARDERREQGKRRRPSGHEEIRKSAHGRDGGRPRVCSGRGRRRRAQSRSTRSRSAKKIASEKVGYGWIVSTRTSTDVSLRTASVSCPSHSVACGPTAT